MTPQVNQTGTPFEKVLPAILSMPDADFVNFLREISIESLVFLTMRTNEQAKVVLNKRLDLIPFEHKRILQSLFKIAEDNENYCDDSSFFVSLVVEAYDNFKSNKVH